MRKFVVVAALVCFAMVGAQAQSVEMGISTASGSTANSLNYSPQTIASGAYIHLGGDYPFWHNLGFGGEVSWRASQAYWGGTLPYRPIFFDFGAVFAPKLSKYFTPALKAGIGAENLHFYTGQGSCGYFGCSNYQSTTHFMGVLGGSLRLYPKGGGFFVAPEANLYLVRNNFEFSGPRVATYGLAVGYTFGER